MCFLIAAIAVLAGGQERTLAETIDAAVAKIPGFRGEMPAPLLDDAVFLKRLTRDLLDAVPAGDEIRTFEDDKDPAKRLKKIDQLLADPRFATFWSRQWMVTFFGKPEDGRLRHSRVPARPEPGSWVACSSSLEPDASLAPSVWERWADRVTFEQIPGVSRTVRARLLQNFEAWLRAQIRKDRPWTEIVSDLIAARGKSEEKPELAYKLSFFRGKGYPLELAQGISKHFMGIRMYCATCHDHPFDKWTLDHFYRLAAFGAREKAAGYGGSGEKDRRHVELSVAREGEVNPPGAPAVPPIFMMGGQAGPDDDRTLVLARLMSAKTNTQLPRMLVNRVWGWLMGSGFVHPVDSFDVRNKPLSREVLEALTRAVTDNKSSMKFLVRTICSTELYQRAGDDTREPAGDWVWRGTVRRNLLGRPAPLEKGKEEALRPSVVVPDSWVRVTPGGKALARWHVPAKKAEWPADLYFHTFGPKPSLKDLLDSWLRQVGKRKTTEEAVDAAGKITLTEVSGTLWCDPRADAPWDYLLLAGLIDTGKEHLILRLEGPADSVREWRGEFLDLLKMTK